MHNRNATGFVRLPVLMWVVLVVVGLRPSPGLFAEETPEESPMERIVKGKALLAEALNTANMEKLGKAQALFEKSANAKAVASVAHYHLGRAEICAADIKRDRPPEELLRCFDRAIQHLEKAIQIDKENAEAMALVSSAYGRKIGLNPMLGMELGPRASESLDKAKKLAPENPRVALLNALNTYHTPPMWGGSKERALEELEKTAKLFETWETQDPTQPEWGHDDTYAWLGYAYLEFDRRADAEKAIEKALALTPQHGFVKYVVKPRLDAAKPKASDSGR